MHADRTNMKARTIALLAAALTLATTSSAVLAVTYLVPTDRQLVTRSMAIVIARATHSAPALNEYGAIVTTTEFTVESVLKGKLEVLGSLRLSEPGGRIGTRATAIPGAPRFADGERYLLFLTSQGESLTTWGLGLGKFDFAADRAGRKILMRGADDGEGVFGIDEANPDAIHVEGARLEEPFLRFIRDTANGRESRELDYVAVEPKLPARPRTSSLSAPPLRTRTDAVRADYLADGIYRWQNPSQTIVVCCSASGSQPGFDGPAAVQAAIANWNNGGGSVHYTYGGDDPSANHGLAGTASGTSDGKNAVLFNDPHGDVVLGMMPEGVLGIGGISAVSPPYTLPDGESFNDIREVDVVIGRSSALLSASQATFTGIVTHELGHTLGFRHSDQTSSNDPNNPCADPLPCAAVGQAIMASTVAPGLATLQQYDRDAVSAVYGNGLVCTAPLITTQPQSSTITEGSVGLSVVATGTSLTYEWFTGLSGNPASGVIGTGSSITVSPTVTTSYWVRATSNCGTSPTVADSTTATVTVAAPPACSAAAITAQPRSATIAQGEGTALSVTATGTNVSYQWFSGTAGNTSSGVIGTGPSITVSPTVTTSYWVRVTSGCGTPPPVADSTAATITVTPPLVCTQPAITAQPLPATIASGDTAALAVSATGTSLTYEWFNGTPGDTSSGVVGSTSSLVVRPAVTTSYWVRVRSGCGTKATVDSAAAVVTVHAFTCSAPSFIFGPADQLILTGQATTLVVAVDGTSPATITWYRGFAPDISIPVGTGSSFPTPPVLFPTTWWARARNACGFVDSANATVTVGACIRPLVTSALASPNAVTVAADAATLSVAAIGTTLTYQWFVGESGVTSTPLPNGNLATVVVHPTATTSYWVRVTSGCGAGFAASGTITVSVACVTPTITTQPADTTLSLATTLTVVATGTAPLRYEWFRGTTTTDRSHPVGGNEASFTVPAATSTNLYFVVVSNACSTVTSRVATVSVTRRRGGRH
jgi:hypothetical protein